MDGVDFTRLTGPQRKMLREALMGVFRRSRDLDMFLDDQWLRAARRHRRIRALPGGSLQPHPRASAAGN
jgi:hypothetical protein